jgi:hypothetical protein
MSRPAISQGFPPRPENWANAEQQKEVYARFGLAAYHAQVFEHGVANLLLIAELVKAKGIVRTQQAWETLVDHVLDSSFQLTLGNMVRRLFEAITLDAAAKDMINAAKRNRDELCHRFFREHAEDFMTSAGRLRMLDRIETLGSEICAATAAMELIEGATAKLIGISPEKTAEYAEAYRRKVTETDSEPGEVGTD